jgi:3'-phosphoadenosine 5'-phosphosulfate sulfotransferase (PAPS reductase)/FAD synthetase
MQSDHRHIVMFSGGIGSWGAAKRVAAKHGTDNMTLLFADTLIEDEDLYRFIEEAAADVGVPLTRIAEGRTPWQVFNDVRYLGNTRADPCSRVLKREVCDRWLAKNCDPAKTTVYVGIDWTEEHRFDDREGGGLRPRRAAAGLALRSAALRRAVRHEAATHG